MISTYLHLNGDCGILKKNMSDDEGEVDRPEDRHEIHIGGVIACEQAGEGVNGRQNVERHGGHQDKGIGDGKRLKQEGGCGSAAVTEQDDEGHGIAENAESCQCAHGYRVDGEVEQGTGRRDRKLVGVRR